MRTRAWLFATVAALVAVACGSDGTGTGGAAADGGGGSAAGSSAGGSSAGGAPNGGAATGGGGASTNSGGGGAGGGEGPPGPPTPTSLAAAKTTAETSPDCVGGAAGGHDLRPFYWEIGDASGMLASGSVTGDGNEAVTASSVLSIASASKWIYSTYWVERIGGGDNLTESDIQFFNFKSGYTHFTSCAGAQTIGGCLDIGQNGVQDPTTIGYFDYGGGHMQVHAATTAGLAEMDNAAFADEIRGQIGEDIAIAYNEPQPAGGGRTSAAEYAKLLQKIVGGELAMRDVLGAHPVCVDPTTCPEAKSSPSPPGQAWHYSIGHWVEDDPDVGDGTFSSAGAFGFYPWIDVSKRYYGVVSRQKVGLNQGLLSAECGRRIRTAFMTGVAQ